MLRRAANVLSSTLFFLACLIPHLTIGMKGFLFFAGLVILMEPWEVALPKWPRICAVETIYMASLFLFQPRYVLGLILIGALGKILSKKVMLDSRLRGNDNELTSDLLQILKRIVLFAPSVYFFQWENIQGNFWKTNFPLHLAFFSIWIVFYSSFHFALSHLEKMLLRPRFRMAIFLPILDRSLFFNLAVIAPLSMLEAVLYQLMPKPFPLALFLLVPTLFVIYRSIENYTESLHAARATIEALSDAVDQRSVFTASHSSKVAAFAKAIAIQMGLSHEEVETIEHAAKILNLGIVRTSDRVLGKKEPLNTEEFATIRQHPEIGARIATQLSLYDEEVKIIETHHEQVNGHGYPKRLLENQIPLGAKIIAVADAYDAMTSPRPYREAFSKEKALNQIKLEAGTKFDKKVVDALLALTLLGTLPQ